MRVANVRGAPEAEVEELIAAHERPRALEQPARGMIVNPATGKLVKLSGRIGKRLAAANAKALVAAAEALPVGHMPRKAPEVIAEGPNYRLGAMKATGAFRRQQYMLRRPPTSLSAFAAALASAARSTKNWRHATITYEDAEGYRINRPIHAKTRTGILSELQHYEYGLGYESGGSDPISTSYGLLTNQFIVGSVQLPAGGEPLKFTGVSKGAGTRHPHFKLIEFAGKASPGDCLFAVCRAVAKAAGCTVPKERNATLRAQLGLPNGPVEASDGVIDGVARLFGLRIRVATGMTVPSDADREFDDNPARRTGRNLCHTEASLNHIAEGGEADAPLCDVYLADSHYQYIQQVLEPIRTCPVTGDILVDAKPFSSVTLRRRVIAQGRVWYGDRAAAAPGPATKRKTPYRERLIFYDYETAYDADGELHPYALGYLVSDVSEDHDFSGESADVVQSYDRSTRFSVTAPLLAELANAPDDVRYTLVSFNGVRFDHFPLAQAAHNKGYLSDIFATSAGLRSVRMGRHATLDLAKLIPGTSLAAACRSFKTAPGKVEGFSHTVPQRAHERGELQQWLDEEMDKVTGYLAGDVLSCASLFVRLRSAVQEVTGLDIIGPAACQTIGQIAWKHMQATCPLPKAVATRELDTTIRSAITGGRVQVYKAKPEDADGPIVIDGEPLRMVDFVSLYPTVMAAVPSAASLFREEYMWGCYPAGPRGGQPVYAREYEPGRVGLYSVTVHSQPWPNVLPKREDNKPLDWSFRGEFETMATHIDIALIREGGGRVTAHYGYVWPTVRKGLFKDFILPLADKKNEQDLLKAAGDPRANPALREMYKLLMNSASGKCCQANYDDLVVLATGSAQQLAAERRMDLDRGVTWLPIGGETCLLMGKKKAQAVYNQASAKPSILAVLIYSYSRALVWTTLCQFNIRYSDTDSGLFSVPDYELLREAFPALDPQGRDKQLGDLDEELGPHASASAYLIAPKDYAVFVKDAFGKVYPEDKAAKTSSKLRAKGVNQRSDRIIAAGARNKIRDMSMAEYTEEYHSAATEASEPIADHLESFFRRRAEGESVHVLCSQLTRTFKDETAPFSLHQRFLIKEL